MAFRFFINVDQCLNMNSFGFFFYQKRSRHELYMLPDVCVGEGGGLSFRKAAAEIRIYLDRFPYNVGDYQIIIAMRSDYKDYVNTWRDTLLSRLLDIDYDLRRSNILIRSGLGVQVAVNMIMLYEANAVKEIHAVADSYMGSARLERDCHLLLKEIGVSEDKENDLEAIKEAWEEYSSKNIDPFDNSLRSDTESSENALSSFFTDLIKQYEKDRGVAAGRANNVSTLRVLKEVLNGYQIFELLTDRQNRDRDINTLLKVVDFSTTDYNLAQGMGRAIPLVELCAAHWNQIKDRDDREIQRKYAKMLWEYKERLSMYARNTMEGYVAADPEQILPETNIPSDNEINYPDSIFENESIKKKRTTDPKELVKVFKKKYSPISTLSDRWEETYKKISKIFKDLGDSLEEYSTTLGKDYSLRIDQRKDIERKWRNTSYVAGEDTERDINELRDKENELLLKMDQPQMTPSLEFQDQLNMETALEQEDNNIRHFIKCMQSLKVKFFFLLIILLLGLVALSYGLLQPYNFEDKTTAAIYVGYLFVSFVLMLLTWWRPIKYYWKKINKCLDRLEDEMDRYIRGYYDRAKQLHEYINLINKLDYIERHIHLKERAVQKMKLIKNARSWHINQAKDHIDKLSFFAGLIATHKLNGDLIDYEDNGLRNDPVISKDHIDDVIDNKLYWPQA